MDQTQLQRWLGADIAIIDNRLFHNYLMGHCVKNITYKNFTPRKITDIKYSPTEAKSKLFLIYNGSK